MIDTRTAAPASTDDGSFFEFYADDFLGFETAMLQKYVDALGCFEIQILLKRFLVDVLFIF
jgi:hypothetical protein